MSSALQWHTEGSAHVGHFRGRVLGVTGGRARLHIPGLGLVECEAPSGLARELGARVGSWVSVTGQTLDSREGVFLGLRLGSWEPAQAPVSFEQMRQSVRAVVGQELDEVDVAQRIEEDLA